MPRQFAQPKKNDRWSHSNKNYKLYNSYKWRQTSKANLLKYPLCYDCKARGVLTPAQVTDHVIPIEEGGSIWNPLNHGSMCKECHNRKSRLEQDGRLYRARPLIDLKDMQDNQMLVPIIKDGKYSEVAR